MFHQYLRADCFTQSLYFYKVRVKESQDLFAFELGGCNGSQVVVDFKEIGDKEIVSTHPTIYNIIYILRGKCGHNDFCPICRNLLFLIRQLPIFSSICAIKFKWGIIIIRTMMLGATNKSLKSTLSSSKASQQPNKRDGFIQFFWRRMLSFMSTLWGRSRRFMWVASTGTCFFIQVASCWCSLSPLRISASSRKKQLK